MVSIPGNDLAVLPSYALQHGLCGFGPHIARTQHHGNFVRVEQLPKTIGDITFPLRRMEITNQEHQTPKLHVRAGHYSQKRTPTPSPAPLGSVNAEETLFA
eukprot:CAMPEP_0172863662 /NCGR_PEP_ID=MMETSP1075-20121228/77992_1 /TAXON_ID=2916 /ORGANISM="Ceratium fusus, Strain PA161109" /LENGTH=100 /DNA_ID=CAMNT_0013712339 /DNA_START=394 /DNA_END=692 /DNA_ORIENTATION=-